ncbi:Hypothetical protein SRAE_1000291200 [Strongyloides ratti]|uniref:PDZ domain-containing protein n=1 Tax=Strongyloides ratti TaxID=34506 RepID=A0A090MX18_STRRB|nr:Hypothetical protein SRAE_1000291200 [Strongyloides ratti]CEF64659.1 Hypothetical protein SRAE_1000291200 [Strongyloides ratti]
MNKFSFINNCRNKCNSIKRKKKDVVNNEETSYDSKTSGISSRFTSTTDRSKRLLKQSVENIHAFFNKEPGTIIAIDEEYPSFKNFEDHDSLVLQLQEENYTEKMYSVICNVPIKEHSIKLDNNNKIKTIIQGSPLNYLLLNGDKIIEYDEICLSDDNKESSIPEEKMKSMKLKILRLGRSKAIPAMRARKHNLSMECNDYHYYIFEVPRIVGTPLGFDVAYNSRQKNFVVVNTTLNSIGGVIFEQGDHLIDINSTLLSSSGIFSEMLKDPKTYPSFTVLVKKPFSKSAIESTKTFLGSLNTVFIKSDMKEIVEKIEEEIINEIKQNEQPKNTILKKGKIKDVYSTNSDSETYLPETNENNCKVNFSQPESEIVEIESNIQNPLYLENVTKNVKFL